MAGRPDKPLVVKCTYDRYNKRITFSSARNCTYDLLRHKVEQCFSLSATSYAIAYKDDDGEITDITTENDLTEAIQYFHAGPDDSVSSAASMLSGRSFGSRKITLRVHITVDYDGPSLSDSSSLASLEEYQGRNGSELSFSLSTPSEQDDDSVTVSSRDTGALSRSHAPRSKRLLPTPPQHGSKLSGESSWDSLSRSNILSRSRCDISPGNTARDPFDNVNHSSSSLTYPSDPTAVFERLKLEEVFTDDATSSINHDVLNSHDRGTAWLRDQKERAARTMLGTLPEPTESDNRSFSRLNDVDDARFGGGLALQRNPRGSYYYSYTSSGASQALEGGGDDGSFLIDPSVDGGNRRKPRPNSRHLNWLASQRVTIPEESESPSVFNDYIPPELLQFLPLSNPPQDELTDCSGCGVLLDALRYVCATCGEKAPLSQTLANSSKGKGKSIDFTHTYPPRRPYNNSTSYSPFSSKTSLGSTESLTAVEGHYLSPFSSRSTLDLPDLSLTGYELCSACMETAGVHHAIEAGLKPESSPVLGSSSPEDAQRAASQWRRSAPKERGKLRHAYHEKLWGRHGWEDVEQDEADILRCSACECETLRHKSYRCASCQKYYLCPGCYSQAHNLHPAHAFLVVSEKPSRTHTDPDMYPTAVMGPGDGKSLKHPGVKCAHCLLDIVGARFHCAICDSVDICANCESAGLPGNLDSADGGHTTSHILIKIPYPLETNEVQTVSQRAVYLWTGRDAANVGFTIPHSKAGSVVSSYAGTVVGQGPPDEAVDDHHHMLCNGCTEPIVGVRYQCGRCESSPNSYNLCSSCEERSYLIHDPMHIFFKLPRRVHRQIESSFAILPSLYKEPVGPSPRQPRSIDPTAYLQSLLHKSTVCDRCMTHIQGPWFRCAYCAKDLCELCERNDNHSSTHFFVVFKALVDMQALKDFADLEQPRPIIPYPIYR